MSKIKCHFCGKDSKEIKKMFGGIPDKNNYLPYICDECIELCYDILQEEGIAIGNIDFKNIPTPKQIKEFLDQHVIGQDNAKKTLATAVYNHYKRINQKVNDIEIQKGNVLMLGSTGSGKTYLVQTLAKILNIPFAIADATGLTEAGYVGNDVENILLRLIESADYDIKKAEKGIIYIDEVDKLTRKSENVSITRDVGGEGVQQTLLKILEGTLSTVPPQGGRKHPQQECIKIDTTNILFICGGAFDGVDKIIQNRIGKKSLGFGAKIESNKDKDVGELLKYLIPQDLIKFGLIPEFVGRLPIMTTLNTLDKKALLNILTEPKNSIIKQYIKLLEMDKIKLEFDIEALEAIVDKAILQNTGARGLRKIIEESMNDIMFDIPDIKDAYKVVITKEVIDGIGNAIVYNKNNKKIA